METRRRKGRLVSLQARKGFKRVHLSYVFVCYADNSSPSKPSRPSRAYLHLTSPDHLLSLSDVVRQSTFEDAQNTFTSSSLIGPPSVEFAPYGKTPGGRKRTDARAGTIDQDPEFMAFLEGLANPTTVKESNPGEGDEFNTGKLDKVTMTPLVQYLKDKKANKNKEAAVKAAKKQESTKIKTKDISSSSNEDTKKKGKGDKTVEKAAKEAVRILNREAKSILTTQASSSATSSPTAETSASEKPIPKLNVTNIPGNQRGAAIAAHIRMLRRDLGLNPGVAHRQARRDLANASKAETVEQAATSSPSTSSPQTPTTPTAPKANSAQPGSRRSRKAASESDSTKGSSNIPAASQPIILLKKPESASSAPTAPARSSVPASQGPKPKPTAVSTATTSSAAAPAAGIRQAFVKHANPSQGVTEPLLKEALEKFGAVTMVEIDKKKGFAYVDFAEPDGLKNAMDANPISVAQGTVQVMQRKTTAQPRAGTPSKPPYKGPTPASRGNGRSGGGGGRGGRGGRAGGRGGSSQNGSSDVQKASSATPSGPSGK